MSVRRFDRESIAGIQADIIIVGSGPAGLVLASELLPTGKTVIVLESGGNERDAKADSLNEVESIGHARSPTDETRCRGLGGSSRRRRPS